MALFSWLGRDALFVFSLSSLRVVVLLCWCRHVARLVVLGSSCRRVASFVVLLSSCRRETISPFSSIRRRLNKQVSGESTFPANFAQMVAQMMRTK